jgi:hypothetical protein
VLGGLAVRVRVVPQGRGRLVDPPGRRPGRTRLDRLVRATVHRGRQMHAVPVDRGRLVQLVADVDHHLLPPRGPKSWPEIVAVDAPRRRRVVPPEIGLTLLHGQVEHPTPPVVDMRLGQWRDRQRPVEVDLTDRVHLRRGVRPGEKGPEPDHHNHDQAREDQEDLEQTAHAASLATSCRCVQRFGPDFRAHSGRSPTA